MHRRALAAAVLFGLLAAAAPQIAQAAPSPKIVAELRPFVEAGLASQDVAVQAWSVRAASLLDDRALYTMVSEQLTNANAPVRVAAAIALLEAGQPAADSHTALANDLLQGDANTRTLILERMLPTIDVSHRVAVLQDALARVTDTAVSTEILRYIAQRTDGDVYALLSRAPAMSAEQRAIVVARVIAADRPIGTQVAGALLASRDPSIRLQGAEVAFALNTVEARAQLEGLLSDPDPILAQRVGFHLSQYGNTAALQAVRDLALNIDQDEALRAQAIAALRDNGAQLLSVAQVDALLAEPGRTAEFRTRVWELLGATRDPAALSRLEGMLDGMFADERLDGLAGLGYSGQGVYVDRIAPVLRGNANQALRLRAAAALGNLGGEQAGAALGAQLNTEPDPAVKLAIIHALAKTGASSAAQSIANEFVSQDVAVAGAALDALEAIGASAVARQIEAVATGFRDPGIRWRAVVLLAKFDPALGRIRLLQALDRPPRGFRDDLVGLPEDLLAEVDNHLLRHADSSVRDAAMLRVLTRDDGGYGVLRPLLDGQLTPDVRRQAISIVTATRNPADTELLRTLTQDIDRGVRLQAYGALAQMGDAANTEFFRGFLENADMAVRLIATYAIARIHANDVPAASPGRRRR